MAGWAGRLCVVLLSPPTVLPGGYQHWCHVGTQFSIQSALEVLAGVSGNSRSRPFPRMKASDSRSRIMGMHFFVTFSFCCKYLCCKDHFVVNSGCDKDKKRGEDVVEEILGHRFFKYLLNIIILFCFFLFIPVPGYS